MTNHYIDYQHSDVILAIGANIAENHPVAMKWVAKSQVRGGKFIVVDPRITRSAAVADMYAPIRPGTDIAFLGGIIKYALDKDLYHSEYVKYYTNAAYLVNPAYKFNEGLFSGFDSKGYQKDTWTYQTDAEGKVLMDETLRDPNCVFQLLKKHFQRYDAATVERITGCPQSSFNKVAETFCATGKPGKAGNICYAMGITQHTYGTQNVRAIAVLQLLLGNLGIAGGGVNAQRGECNVQGSTDMGMLYHILPGYVPYPEAKPHPTLAAYNKTTPTGGYWTNRPKFIASMLKAWWPDAAPENDFRYDYLPKLDGRNHSHMAIFDEMHKGNIIGFFAWGQNPAVGGPDSVRERAALAQLDWMVAIDLFETETAAFWKRPGVDPGAIKTEVFLLPAANSYEKEGSVANSGRWIQWRYKAVNPPGAARSDLWIADRLFKAVRALYTQGGVFPDPILKMKWDYGDAYPDIAKVALEINGYDAVSGEPLLNFTRLADNGSTACGNWIYSGYYNNLASPPTKRRIRETSGIGLHPNWSFAWPLNRRILYNRASADPSGKPYNPNLALVRWDGSKWLTNDVPDFNATVAPEVSAKSPFIMCGPETQARLFAGGLAEGPFPEHYEPAESPVKNSMSAQQTNPMLVSWAGQTLAPAGSDKFPFIGTTYRVCEHWQSGIMTRNSPWLNEVMPNMFVEISTSLARQRGIKNGDRVAVSTARGEIRAIACVTERIKPMKVNGQLVEMVGMPWHWGYQGMSRGDSANVLTASIGDANTSIPEYKAFLCNIRRVV